MKFYRRKMGETIVTSVYIQNVGTAIVIKSKEEQDNRTKARKYAMTKLMKKVPDKALRKRYWEEFFATSKINRRGIT